MRNWCVALALSVLLALPLCAQEKSGAAGGDTGNAGISAEKPAAASNAAGTGKAALSKNTFALPAAAKPTPVPTPQAAAKDTSAPGLLLPRYEIAGMYYYLNGAPGDPFANFGSHGGGGSFAYNASKWLGLVGEFGGYNFNRSLFPLTGSSASVNGSMFSYLFGPRLNLRRFNYFVPFAEFLVGGARGDNELTGTGDQSAFALAAGGGVDMVLTKNLAWRVAQLDYLMTSFSGPALGANARQNSFRAGTGLVLRFGFPSPPPPPPKRPPVAACSVNPASVYEGSGDIAAVHVNASSPDNLPLTYSYTATGGTVEGTGPDARWNSTGVAVGTYTVTAKVDDGKGGFIPYKARKEPIGGSTVDGKTRVVYNGDGTHTVTTTDDQGKQTPVVKPDQSARRPPIHYVSPKEPIGGSTVDGKTRVVYRGDGTHTVTTTDDQGKQTPVVKPDQSARLPTHYVSPKEPIGGSTIDGKITVVYNGDGTHTVTTTDDQGRQTAVVKPNQP